jgi:hypothetical protein
MVRKKKSTQKIYFTDDTELAILEYLKSDDPVLRNKIYNERIHYPFYKLSENLIHTFKFYYTEVDDLEDLKHEVITFFLEKLHYFKEGQGKAFSYFSIIGKNYLILYNNKNYVKKKGKADPLEADNDNEILMEFDRQEVRSEKVDFLDIYTRRMGKKIFDIFKKEEELKVADAILEVFRKRDHLEIFNKKAIYIYIREITGIETPVITKVVKIMREYFNKYYSDFLERGHIYNYE